MTVDRAHQRPAALSVLIRGPAGTSASRRLTRRSRLTPLENDLTFCNVPSLIDLEPVEVEEPCNHHQAGALLGIDVVGDGVAVSCSVFAIETMVLCPLKCIVCS